MRMAATGPGEVGKAQRVQGMFDGIARRYDLLNRILSLGIDGLWRREAARLALATGATEVLDVATGTGDLAFELARRAPHASITGVDFSGEMLAIARNKAARRGRGVSFAHADAQALPFADASFDAVTIAYGLRNLEEPGRGLGEFRRVLRPGGRLVVLEFPPPPGGLWGALVRLYFTRVLPLVGGLVSGSREAYTYLPGSVMTFTAPQALADRMLAAGFGIVRYRLQSGGLSAVHVADVGDAATPAAGTPASGDTVVVASEDRS